MIIKVHISMATVDEKIDYYIRQNNAEPYEDGPIALNELYKFVIDGVAKGKFDNPAAVCAHVQRRTQEYMETE